MSTTANSIQRLGTVIAAAAACSALCGVTNDDPAKIRRLIEQADFYVREFEKEVSLQRGGEKKVWRSQRDALEKVRALKMQHPDDPRVEALFRRTRSALKRSKGDFVEVQEVWTQYLHNEDNLRQLISRLGEEEWKRLVESRETDIVKKAFPAPNSAEVSVEELKGKYVILEDVEYPAKQFYGASGEFIWCGKPSCGFWFIDLAGRDWLGPYEAAKRYRRMVDSSMQDVKKWTVLAEISGITAENPLGGEEAPGAFHFGWILKPVALKIPGHLVAVRDKDAESSGRFIGEEKVEALKQGWYTVKDVPKDVAPDRLMEIFMTAIKEKNMKLYLQCIDPELMNGAYGRDEAIRYHWDLHQERFHGEYVHASFSKPKITVQQGFDRENELQNFFLDDDDRKTLEKIGGERVEVAVVESIAYDRNGKQLGTPHPHRLRRKGDGRWYVLDYQQRF
jgi:hypothetical protein